MPKPTIRSILVPTDFSDDGDVAFEHALSLALAFKAELDIFHVEPHNDAADWRWAPKVVETLVRWGRLPSGAGAADLERLGLRARRTTSTGERASEAILGELASSHADLVVVASHGRSGLDRWIQPSVAAPIATRGAVPVLVFPRKCRRFVDGSTGAGGLGRVILPVDHRPHPGPAFDALGLVVRALPAENVQVATLHVGGTYPEMDLFRPDPSWVTWRWSAEGDAVGRIVDAAATWNADLVIAVTEGRQNFLDGLRGSTIERLLDRLTCPLLVVPGGWGAVPT